MSSRARRSRICRLRVTGTRSSSSALPTPLPCLKSLSRNSRRGGWLQVNHGPERAGAGSFTLAVSDIEEIVKHVAGLGMNTSMCNENTKVKS